MIEPKLYMNQNGHWMVPLKADIYYADQKSNMAATSRLSLYDGKINNIFLLELTKMIEPKLFI